jgi:hypothetical protein
MKTWFVPMTCAGVQSPFPIVATWNVMA